MELVKNIQSFLQSCNKSLINQACSGPYWENIGPRSFLYGPRCTRSVLSRPRADILPVRPSRLVNKIYICDMTLPNNLNRRPNLNTPFPCRLLPLCQNESLCETIHVAISPPPPPLRVQVNGKQTQFHIKGFARGLALKQPFEATCKWLLNCCVDT